MGDQPFFLTGNFAPVRAEVEAHDLAVTGSIPPALDGLYVRNGANPRQGSSAHWFFGDGMLHGVRVGAGQVSWYRNRWVRTRQLTDDAPIVRDDFTVDHSTGPANTHVVAHAGRLLALVEASWPVVVTSSLDTVGPWDFDGRLTTAMTAHPKTCPVTGELHFFGYGFAPPYLTYHVASPAGELVHSAVVDVPGPTMIHDFAITEHHVVWMDLPVVFDVELAMAGTMPFAWSDSYGARLGVMPRARAALGEGVRATGAADVRWFDIEPCYVFHVLNAYDDVDRVVVDVARYDELWRGGDWVASAEPHLCRWEVDPGAGRVCERQLDDQPGEFPRIDDRRTGLAHRYGYLVSSGPGGPGSRSEGRSGPGSGSIVRYDLVAGTSTAHDLGPGRVPGEAVFAPDPASAPSEDAGWLLTYVYDAGRDGSDLVVLDASDIAAPPVAVVELPQRVPFGFHGSWVPDGSVG